MQALHTLPLQMLEPLHDRSLSALRQAAEAADQRWLYADLSKCRTLSSVLHRLADLLKLPEHFGQNLDALYDCLAEMTPPPAAQPGFVLVIEGLLSAVPIAQRNALLEVLQSVGEDFATRGIAYRVFYALADQD